MPRKQQRALRFGEMVYWNSGDVLGPCDECDDDAFTYTEDGERLCADCLAEQSGEMPEEVDPREFLNEFYRSI